MNICIETTADGSPTLYRPDIDEHYHSVKGALAESRHVYLYLGWEQITAQQHFSPLRVFEVGFGTGLNAALTAHAAMKAKCATVYYAIELYPLADEISHTLINNCNENFRQEFEDVVNAPWNVDYMINPYFTLHKIQGDLLSHPLPDNLDLIYFDAFAPEKQPDLWSETVFNNLFHAMRTNGVLTTYCAKGAIRRLLQKVGFRTERLAGPPDGKREVLRATKP